MLQPTSTVCIHDKNGKHFNTLCGQGYEHAEIQNMQRHLARAKANPSHYAFLDLATSVILVNGEPYVDISDDELLKELLS